jgi:outer membrane protein insertion porin family
MMRSLHVAVALLLAPAALAQHPVVEIKVAGNQRLAAAAVIAASGLRVGRMATHADLDAAAQKLADTGFFASVSYRYDPKPAPGGGTGYALTFQVSEQPALVAVQLDIPGQDTERLWQQLKAADALIDRHMPDGDRATAYYKRAIEEALRKSNHPEEIVVDNEGNVITGKMTAVVFRLAHLPQVAAIRFEGNAAIAESALQAAMAKVAIGQDYTERNFRRKLELNLRPLYEDLGHLTVSFPQVTMAAAGDAAVTVTAVIDEGPAWRLGKVVLKGDALPLADMNEAGRFAYGAPANWKQFLKTVEDMEKVLRRDGYLRVSSNPLRSFQDQTQIVDVTVEVAKGPQFLFGEMHVEGLDVDTQQRLAALWKLPKGAPMNPYYVTDFFRSVAPSLKGKFKTFGSELHFHKDANVVDITLKFQ